MMRRRKLSGREKEGRVRRTGLDEKILDMKN